MSTPIEECYKILQKGSFKVSPDESEKVDTFRYKFKKMLELAGDVQVQTRRLVKGGQQQQPISTTTTTTTNDKRMENFHDKNYNNNNNNCTNNNNKR